MANQRCIDYIRANIGKFPLEALKQVLAKSGVAAADIEEAARLATQELATPVEAAPAAPASGAPGASASYSHPDSPVRHTYPLVVSEDGFGAALELCLKTLPLIGLRLGLLAAFTAASVVWFLIIYFVSGLLGRASQAAGVWTLLLLGFGVPAGSFRWFKRYALALLELAHVAVLTRLITHGGLQGKDQVSYGKELVVARFGEVNLLFVLQSLITGVVGAFTGTVDWLAGLLPLPGLEGLANAARQVVRFATGYVGDAIFSYNLARGDENPWRSSKDGLVYYAQNWKPVLKTAVWAFILEHVLSFLAFCVLLAPCVMVGARLPTLGAWIFVIALALAANVKSAVLRPVFSTMVMLTYHKAIRNQAIDPSLDQTLSSASRQFQELGERARSWVSGRAAGLRPAGGQVGGA